LPRLARTAVKGIVHELKARGVALRATEQPVDTGTAAGKAFLDMLGVFTEFETNLRRERQLEGINAAKARGVYKGRKPSIDAVEVLRLRREEKLGPVRQNRDVVDRLATELKNRGVTVWLDRNDIEPGTRWRDAIKKAIQSGKFFIACFSREFNERNKSYMNEELTLAIDELRERPSEKNWFIPILVNETYIPSRRISNAEDLSHRQAIRLYESWDIGISRVLRTLRYDDPTLARIGHLADLVEGPFEHERLYAIRQSETVPSARQPIFRQP
jgi:hypothetical protein